MGKIKIIRKGIWETNSSSSHAVTVFGGDMIERGDPEFDLDIRDNILYVPIKGDHFGWDFEKSNHPSTKLQYVCGLFFIGVPGKAQKREKILTTLLKEHLGVSDVKYEWNEKYMKDLEENGIKYTERLIPEVDHQSREDGFFSICTRKEDIIDFIFSRRSWWYGGNDNSTEPEDFYSEIYTYPRGKVSRIVSMELPGEIGRYDIEVRYNQTVHDAIWYGEKKVYEYTYYDLSTDTVKTNYSNISSKNSNYPSYLPFDTVEMENGIYYIIYGIGNFDKGEMKTVYTSPVVKIPMKINFLDIDYVTEES